MCTTYSYVLVISRRGHEYEYEYSLLVHAYENEYVRLAMLLLVYVRELAWWVRGESLVDRGV
jgi:hypothetical protein